MIWFSDCYRDGVFYHYTSTANAKNIQRTGVIYKGKHGTILNKMDPHQFFRNEILQNNYGRKMDDHQNKADYVVLVTEGQLNYRYLEEMKQNNRHFFLYYKNINVSATQIFDKPKCSSRNVQKACSSYDGQNPYANNGQSSSANNDQSIGSSNNSAPLFVSIFNFTASTENEYYSKWSNLTLVESFLINFGFFNVSLDRYGHVLRHLS